MNGSADTSEAVCRPSSPLLNSRTAAMAPISKPQTIRGNSGGFKVPLAVITPRIYVAESADVIKNVKISRMDSIETKKLKGNWL